jgi:hypothetical protein
LLLRTGRQDWRRRRDGSLLPKARGSAASVLARLGPFMVVGLLLGLLTPAPAAAAGPDAAPQQASPSSAGATSAAPSPQPAPTSSSSPKSSTSAISADPSSQPAPTSSSAPKSSPPSGPSQAGSEPPNVTPTAQGGSSAVVPSETATHPSSAVQSPSISTRTGVVPSPTHHKHPRATATRRAAPLSHPPVHRPTASAHVAFPVLLARRLELLDPGSTGPLRPLTRGDPALMLLGALALAVLVLASTRLLRLLARLGRDGYEGSEP